MAEVRPGIGERPVAETMEGSFPHPEPDHRDTIGRCRLGPKILVLALFIAAFVIFARSIYSFNHNDFLYAAAATRRGTLYQDIHYVQAPLGYWFWHLVHLLSPDGHSYVIMRVTSILLTILSLIPPLLLLHGRYLARIAFLLGITSTHYVAVSSIEIGNYSLSLLLFSIAFCSMFSTLRSRYFISGIAFGLATATKLSFAVFVVPAAFTILLSTGSFRMMARRLGSGAVGFALGSAPALAYLAGNPGSFLFHNIAFHTEITNAYRGLGPGSSILDIASDLLAFFANHLYETGTLLALLLASAMLSQAARSSRWPRRLSAFHSANRVRDVYCVAAFFGAALVGACSPMIMFDQYLVVPGFILVTGTCLLFGQSRSAFDASVLTYYLAFSVARLPLIVLPLLASLLSQPTTWSLHFEAEKRIRNAIAETSAAEDCKHEIFTLSGSLAIDAGIPLSAYTEAGAFWARVADFVPEHYKKDARHAFDPYLIDPMSHVLGNDIAFVLAGYYPRVRFEREFLSRSADLGFAPIETVSFDKKTLTLFFRKACEYNPGLP